MKIIKRLLAVSLLLCLAFSSVAAAENDGYQKYQRNFFGTFDTMVTVIGYTQDATLFDEMFAEIEAQFTRYHQVYDGYNAYADVKNLYYLNREASAGEAVAVEPELIELLQYCKEHQLLTHGKVNVAMGAVLTIWHDYREDGIYDPAAAELPPMETLEAAAQHVNFDDVVLDEAAGTVTFLDPKLRLDVGAIAKGYATEQVSQWLLQGEMPSFLISAGGNVRVGDSPQDGRQRWVVSIQDPDGVILSTADDDVLDKVILKNGSVVTSGDYQRYYVVDGKRYHHLIDPDTLMPADYARSVTIVCEDSGWADMLSTAVFLMDYDAGRAYVDGLDDVEALWLLADGTIEMTDGMRTLSYNEGARSRD